MHHLIAPPRCIEGCCAYTVTWGACTCLSVYGESHVRGTLYARPIDPPLYFPRGVYSVRTHVSGQPSWKVRSVCESCARRRPAVLAIYVQFTPAREVRYIHVFFSPTEMVKGSNVQFELRARLTVVVVVSLHG